MTTPIPSPAQYTDWTEWASAVYEHFTQAQPLQVQSPTCVANDMEINPPPESGLITYCKTDGHMYWSDDNQRWFKFARGPGWFELLYGGWRTDVFDGDFRTTGTGVVDGGSRF